MKGGQRSRFLRCFLAVSVMVPYWRLVLQCFKTKREGHPETIGVFAESFSTRETGPKAHLVSWSNFFGLMRFYEADSGKTQKRAR